MLEMVQMFRNNYRIFAYDNYNEELLIIDREDNSVQVIPDWADPIDFMLCEILENQDDCSEFTEECLYNMNEYIKESYDFLIENDDMIERNFSIENYLKATNQSPDVFAGMEF